MKSFSDELKRLLALNSSPLASVTSSIFSNQKFDELYLRYLKSLHWAVRASLPLMELCIKQSLESETSEEFQKKFVSYLAKHIEEEKDHDNWLMRDLEIIGFKKENMHKEIPSITVASLVGSQYYWINHYDPISIIGYIAAIEGSPLSQDALKKIKKASKYPQEAFRTLEVHAVVDMEHSKELYCFIDSLELSKQQQSLIQKSALATIYYSTKLLEDVVNNQNSA